MRFVWEINFKIWFMDQKDILSHFLFSTIRDLRFGWLRRIFHIIIILAVGWGFGDDGETGWRRGESTETENVSTWSRFGGFGWSVRSNATRRDTITIATRKVLQEHNSEFIFLCFFFLFRVPPPSASASQHLLILWFSLVFFSQNLFLLYEKIIFNLIWN